MKEKSIISLVFTFVVLIFLLSIMNGSIYLSSEEMFNPIPNHILVVGVSMFIIIGLIINGFLVKSLLQLVEKEAEFNIQSAYTDSMDELFNSMREQRHDFNNHVQVIHGMIKENLIDLAREYITEIFIETRELNEIIIIVDRPEIAALLKAKHSTAIRKNIDFKVSMTCKLSPLKIKPHDLIRVLGNIIDNAFDEAMNYPEEDKQVSLSIFSKGKEIIIKVLNPGVLPEDFQLIFQPGISNKPGHSGLGLHVVKQLVEKYQGDVNFQMEENSVQCKVILPLP